MVNDSLDHSDSALNLDLCDSLTDSVNKTCALACVATLGFSECEESIKDNYMVVLRDFADKAKEASDELCERVLKRERSIIGKAD